jgi:tRNA U34 5-methylaminomethyl-2-thiouridine-forming methyltransferase MnmC
MQPISCGLHTPTPDILHGVGNDADKARYRVPSRRPEGPGNCITAFYQKIGHDLGGKRRKREAGLEAAVGDELTATQRMSAQQQLSGRRPRADAGPARNDRSPDKGRAEVPGPRDQRFQTIVGGGGISPVLLGCRADGGRAVAMRDDVKTAGMNLWPVAGLEGKKRSLPPHTPAKRRRTGKTGISGRVHDGPPALAVGHDADAARGECRNKRRNGCARSDPGRKIVMCDQTRRPGRQPVRELPCGAEGQPRPSLPGDCSRSGARFGPGKRRGIRDGLKPADAGKERIPSPGRGNGGPPVSSHQQRVTLERLGFCPGLGRMGGKRAHEPATGPGAGSSRVDDGDARAPPGDGPGEREAKDAGAKNGDIGQRMPVAGKGAPGTGRGGGFTPPHPRGIFADKKWGKALDDRGVDWSNNLVPVSRRYGDPYFSLEGGLAETEHVFLAGSGLPGRFGSGQGGLFRIGELGFGTGLNVLATLALWQAAGRPGRVRFTSFEGFALTGAEMARALSAFPRLAGLVPGLLAAVVQGGGTLEPGFTLRIVAGDVRETLPREPEPMEAWYLDGFAPAKNPEMWGPEVLAAVAARLVPGGTVATYTAAGDVRRGLAAAGLEVTRTPGYGRKRHMTLARKPL